MEQLHAAGNFVLMTSLIFLFVTCGQRNSQAENDELIKRDHAEISAMLDKAMLSESPVDSFTTLIPKIQSYGSVDSAWLSGTTFFVKYKYGGTVSWIVPPKSNN